MTQNTTQNRAQNTTRGRAAGAVLGAATVTSGLMAGVFFAYATSVMPGLGRSDDRTFIEVMQNIDDAIYNPVFFAAFLGALALTALGAWQQRRAASRGWVFAALVLYAAAFLVTVGVNVPLNDDLVAAGDPERIADPGAVRETFEDPWIAWNIVRTVLSTAALVCLWRATALVRQASAYLVPEAWSSASR
ncbi:DUF1772 domain-containing protein [Streptomyces sp. NPDC020681]|uniref:DUF1772 domain-containing protein n=1 Tax=Streptomyces sp. NPDC020681 TaxID=3365083 RepID=UPI0037B46B8B